MAAPTHNGTRLSFTFSGANDGTLTSVAVGEAILVNVRWYGTDTITTLTCGGVDVPRLGSPQTGGPDNARSQWAILPEWAGSAGNQTVSVQMSGSNPGGVEAWRISGHDTTTPVAVRNGASGSGTSVSVTLSSAPAECIGFAIGSNNGGSDWSSPGDSWTLLTIADAFWYDSGSQKADLGSAGDKTVSATIASGTWVINAIAIQPASSATVDQQAFRFGSDDGSESAHGWLAAQNTNITRALGSAFLLRHLLQFAGDHAAITPVLRAQKNGAGGYQVVPVGATGPGTTPLIEAGDCTQTGNNTAQDPWAVGYPNASTGDLLIFCLGWDDSTNVTGVTPPAGPNGETFQVIRTVFADSGTTVRGYVGYYIATGAWTASTLSFDPSASEQWGAVCIRVPAGEFDATTPIGAVGSATTDSAGSNIATPAFSAGSGDGNGRLVVWLVVDDDPITGTPTGWTQRSYTDIGALSVNVATRDAAVTASESIGSVNFTVASDTAVQFAFIVRAPIVSNELYVAASSNIASGGEATTSRLTGGTGTFLTGRRWDDENGSDALDPGTDQNTEIEHSLTTQSPAQDGDFWDFRVYRGASALDSYTATGRLTLGTPATPSLLLPQGTFARVPALRRF
jgi:hypothetical protein